MHTSSEPHRPVTPTVDRTVQLFRASLISTAGLAVLFGVSWQQPGIWPLIEGVLISFSLCCGGGALVFTIRARALTAPTTIRPWMRAAAAADVILAVAIAGLTLWRWRA